MGYEISGEDAFRLSYCLSRADNICCKQHILSNPSLVAKIGNISILTLHFSCRWIARYELLDTRPGKKSFSCISTAEKICV